MSQPPRYLSTSQIAAVYGVSESTVRRWVKEGRFTPAEMAPRKGVWRKFVAPTTATGTNTNAA